MFTNKKAVSQLISWVLLIGFAIAMATVITNWAREQVDEIKFEKEAIKELCQDIEVDITGACRDPAGDKIRLRIENPGYFNIPFATVGRSTANIPESWCFDLDFGAITNLTAPLIKEYSINGTFLNADFDDDLNQFTPCDTLSGNLISENIDSFTIIPWIRVEEQNIPCVDKKVVISQENLICDCMTPGEVNCPND